MKRFFLSIAAVSLLSPWASAQEWLTDYNKALSQAKAQNKPLVIDFTGSDWCGWCIKLDREVFNTADFKAYAAQKLVLLKVDFPKRKPLPPQEQAENKKLADRFGVQGFPTVVILKPNGSKAGELGYQPGGPSAFIASLEKVTGK